MKEAISLQLQAGGQAAVGDVGEGNPRAIWRSLMRIRSAIGDDDRVTTTFAQCERALSTAGTAQQQPPAVQLLCLAGVFNIEPSLRIRVKTILLDRATYRAVGIA